MTPSPAQPTLGVLAAEAQTSLTPITVVHGDGIGPEIMDATLRLLHAADARLVFETVASGEAVYRGGITSGISPDAWTSLRRTRILLKGPITTPQGGGYKSLNVTLRKTLGLYANVRPCVSYAPFVRTRHDAMDVVIIRENEEDTYAGIEHRQTREVTQCLKLITRPGCERIVRYAFEFARRNQRKKVSCFTKDNIHKITDGLFSRVFREIAAEYSDIEHDHWIIDIGAAMLADQPERFDVIVTPNLYGDILSDIAAQISGSVGLGASANIGRDHAMFEAIHGSAPAIAGQGIANPSGLMLAAVMMLAHLRQCDAAERIHNAWLATIEDGLHTPDLYDSSISQMRLGTADFADAVIARLGREPSTLAPVRYADKAPIAGEVWRAMQTRAENKELVGVDVFLDWDEADRSPQVLGSRLQQATVAEPLELLMITNRGVKVFPNGHPETCCTDHWRCRFVRSDRGPIPHRQVLALLHRIEQAGFDFIKTEHLYTFGGLPGYSLGQGE